LSLSIVLARRFGIYGVAIGTLIPSLLVHLFLWPMLFSRILGLGGAKVVWGVWGPMFLTAVPFAIASYAVNVLFPPRNLLVFGLQTIALLPIFYLAVAAQFRVYVRNQVLPQVRSRVRSMFVTASR